MAQRSIKECNEEEPVDPSASVHNCEEMGKVAILESQDVPKASCWIIRIAGEQNFGVDQGRNQHRKENTWQNHQAPDWRVYDTLKACHNNAAYQFVSPIQLKVREKLSWENVSTAPMRAATLRRLKKASKRKLILSIGSDTSVPMLR